MSQPTTYEIVIRGRASERLLRPLLDDFTIDDAGDGVTRLLGDIGDPSHLHGVLAHLTSVNAEVVSVAPWHPRHGAGAGPDATTPTPTPTPQHDVSRRTS